MCRLSKIQILIDCSYFMATATDHSLTLHSTSSLHFLILSYADSPKLRSPTTILKSLPTLSENQRPRAVDKNVLNTSTTKRCWHASLPLSPPPPLPLALSLSQRYQSAYPKLLTIVNMMIVVRNAHISFTKAARMRQLVPYYVPLALFLSVIRFSRLARRNEQAGVSSSSRTRGIATFFVCHADSDKQRGILVACCKGRRLACVNYELWNSRCHCYHGQLQGALVSRRPMVDACSCVRDPGRPD